jgi:hypothetical protein
MSCQNIMHGTSAQGARHTKMISSFMLIPASVVVALRDWRAVFDRVSQPLDFGGGLCDQFSTLMCPEGSFRAPKSFNDVRHGSS